MSAHVYRISVHTGNRDGCTDLALPAHLPLAELMPDIVRLATDDLDPARHWRLSRLCGAALDEDVALAEQDVADGDLLVLSAEHPPVPRFGHADIATAVAAAAPGPPDLGALRTAVGVWAALAGAAAWLAGPPGEWFALVTAAVTLCVVTVVTVLTGRAGCAPGAGGPLAMMAVASAAVCASQVVGGPLGAPHALLAVAAAAAMASVLLRFSLGPPVALTAMLTAALLIAAALGTAVLWRLPASAVGVVSTALALGVLAAAPRMSIALAGLAPAASLADEPVDDASQRAATGHRVLSGLVTGCSGALVFGSAAVLFGYLQGQVSAPAGALFGAAVGSAQLLRGRTYVSGVCGAALTVAGTASLTAAFVTVVAGAPQHAHWAAAAAVAVGVAVIRRDPGREPTPIGARAVDVAEYLALAAVAPSACAVLGLFDMVRHASLL